MLLYLFEFEFQIKVFCVWTANPSRNALMMMMMMMRKYIANCLVLAAAILFCAVVDAHPQYFVQFYSNSCNAQPTSGFSGHGAPQPDA